jgi:penicillin-binding protein 1C
MTGNHRLRAARRVFVAGLAVGLATAGGERALDAWAPFPFERLGRFGASVEVLARDGTPLRVTTIQGHEKLLHAPIDEVSPVLIDALIAAEDERFLSHAGVDLRAIARAALQNLAAGRVVSGASTLTMQMVRMVEPRPRTLTAKLCEAFRARQLERVLGKRAILQWYVDHVPLGGVLRGFEAGARHWFGKSARALTPAEAATLCAMIPAPSARAPDRNPALVLERRDHVLRRMLDTGRLDAPRFAAAVATPLGALRHGWPYLAPHACDLALAAAGPTDRTLATGIDLGLQRDVESLLRSAFRAVEGTHGGGDGGAVVVLARADGALRSAVGSPDLGRSQWNAAQSRRCAGSTLKPFLWALALDRGATGPDGVLRDDPVAFGGYEPHNFDREFLGPIDAAEALAGSRNLPAVRLCDALGVDAFTDLLRRLGLPLDPRGLHLDVALGTLSVAPIELARAWVRLCAEPASVGLRQTSVTAVLEALSMRDLATGLPARSPFAWKTGTSSGRRDAWCVAITRAHVVVVWLGNLDGRGAPSLTGAEAATGLCGEIVALLAE